MLGIRLRVWLVAWLVACLVIALPVYGATGAWSGLAAAVEAVRYEPPVSAPVVDAFRPPAHRYGSGNRGHEYDTGRGDTVRAAGRGRVGFAGSVAGRLVVSIDHPDGLRTTYTGLASIAVRRGDEVAGGATVGSAGGRLHFGVRAGRAYLDPAALFDQPDRVHLVRTRRWPARDLVRTRSESVVARHGPR